MFGFFILSVPFLVQSLHKVLDPQPKVDLDSNKKKEPEQSQQYGDGGINNNLWSELDDNLIGEIVGRLCLTDQVRFGGVCKNWLAGASHPFNNNTKSLPWYLSFDCSLPPVSNRFDIKLYDSSSSLNLPSLHSISLSKLGIGTPPSYKNIACTFKCNWLFVLIGTQTFFSLKRRYFFLFSPFTRKIITLPKFDSPLGFLIIFTFSTQPDSPDCVFFLLDAHNAGKIFLFTLGHGDTEWTCREFKTVPEFVPCTCEPVYLHGLLYIVSPFGQLVSYNILDGEFKFESLFIDEHFDQSFRSSRRHEVFELNGELMIIYYGSRNKNNVTLSSKQCIKRYNWSNKRWIPVSTLHDKALFVSDINVGVAKINKEDMSDGVLSNKIYHFFDGGCLIYSIEGGELVEYKSINSSFLEDDDGDLPKYKYDGGISFSNAMQPGYWLKPPCIMSTPPQTV